MNSGHLTRYIFLRGAFRNTTLSIVENIVDAKYDRMSKKALIQLLVGEFNKTDVIIHDDLGWDALLLTLVKLLRGYKIVIRLRGDAFRVLKNGPYYISYFPRKLMTAFILNNANYILFNSMNMRAQKAYRFAEKHSGIAYNPLMIGHLALDLEEIIEKRSENTPFRLLTVTNFNMPEKIAPLETALRDWIDPAFLEANNMQWDIVGGGLFLENFVKHVNIDRFAGRIAIHGHSDDVMKFYEKSNLLVYLTGFDAFPNVALEGAFYALPIITNRDSLGTREAMNEGESGKVVSCVEDLKADILNYRNDPALCVRHGLAGRRFVLENYSIEKQRAKATTLLRGFFEGSAR